jgi:hypothetical protein
VQGARPIAVLNRSTAVADADLEVWMEALQAQVDRDFASAWGLGAELDLVASDATSGWEGKWNLVVLDTSDQAGALGYHELTPDGLPLGKVYAKDDHEAGSAVSVTLSHELLEMLADPHINLTALDQPDAVHGRLYACEVCDPCEADRFAYDIDGVAVSDFVFPGWFDPSARGRSGDRFDQAEEIRAPFELLPGGYIGYLDMTSPNGWQQLTADGGRAERPRSPARWERRGRPRDRWRLSGQASGDR